MDSPGAFSGHFACFRRWRFAQLGARQKAVGRRLIRTRQRFLEYLFRDFGKRLETMRRLAAHTVGFERGGVGGRLLVCRIVGRTKAPRSALHPCQFLQQLADAAFSTKPDVGSLALSVEIARLSVIHLKRHGFVAKMSRVRVRRSPRGRVRARDAFASILANPSSDVRPYCNDLTSIQSKRTLKRVDNGAWS